MPRTLSVSLAAAALAVALVPAAASADGIKRTASGAAPADITAAVGAFRADIGGNNNAGGPPAASGRREINWDGVPDASADPNPFPGGFFLARGVQYDTPGTGFLVSAKTGNPTATPLRFNNPEFQAFSQERLFAANGSTITDNHFFVPGTATPATTNAFGVVFTDVDTNGSAKLEFFDPAGALIDTVVAPASPNGGLSFAGESFNAGERVARVRITSGTTATLTSDAGQDSVAMDDFIYAEPQPGEIAFQLAEQRVQEDAGTASLVVTRKGANSGTATVAYATADGTAKAGEDYTTKTGTVTFGPGETTKAISIAVSADTLKENDETFTVALSDTTGAALAAPRVETVTLQDRSPAPDAKAPKAALYRILKPGLRFVIASDEAGSYRYKLTLTAKQAKALGLKSRTLKSSGKLTLKDGSTNLTITLGRKLRGKLHRAHIRPKLTISLSDLAGNKATLTQKVTI
jgi:Calx-beta domain-containing protein